MQVPTPRHPALVPAALGVLALVAVGLASCYPGSVNGVEELDTVITLYEPEAPYGSYVTYEIAGPDSILHRSADTGELVTRDYDDEILAKVKQKMAELGYQEVANPGSGTADIIVLLSIAAQQFQGWVGWPWWPGYGCPGCGITYPPTGGAVIYDVGTLFITWVDFGFPAGEDEVPVVWEAAVNGLLADDTDTAARLDANIDQAFLQSPYLGRTP